MTRHIDTEFFNQLVLLNKITTVLLSIAVIFAVFLVIAYVDGDMYVASLSAIVALVSLGLSIVVDRCAVWLIRKEVGLE